MTESSAKMNFQTRQLLRDTVSSEKECLITEAIGYEDAHIYHSMFAVADSLSKLGIGTLTSVLCSEEIKHFLQLAANNNAKQLIGYLIGLINYICTSSLLNDKCNKSNAAKCFNKIRGFIQDIDDNQDAIFAQSPYNIIQERDWQDIIPYVNYAIDSLEERVQAKL